MLTDVEDNSFKQDRKMIEKAAASSVFLTIVGIGKSFRADICEEMVNITGYNYFCAV